MRLFLALFVALVCSGAEEDSYPEEHFTNGATGIQLAEYYD